jgi:phage FluMu gp28-like protein
VKKPVKAKVPRKDAAVLGALSQEPTFKFRSYQLPTFKDRTTPLVILHWSRQIGKSFTLANWCVDRLLTRPGRLIVVLSNSKDNGKEFAQKCAEAARAVGVVCENLDLAPGSEVYEEMNYEIRIVVSGKIGRVKVLAANPRTARGFSGDLILDEFAFHQDADAIWDAAEPILSSNPDYLCRIASTGNGTGNLFYRMVTSGKYPVVRVTRTDAWKAGVKIRSAISGKEITPSQAREEALDKASYDQNYECAFASAQGPLLPASLVDAAERIDSGIICTDAWSPEAKERIRSTSGRLALGFDIARRGDFSVMSVWERTGSEYFCRALLRARGMSLVDQENLVAEAVEASGRRLSPIVLDATGIGEGPADYLSRRFPGRVIPIHFSSSLPLSSELASQGERGRVAPAPLVLAARLHRLYLDGQIRHPIDQTLRDDLQKPRRVLTETGRASIAADSGPDGHADHFWSFALALYQLSQDGGGAFTDETIAQVQWDTGGLEIPSVFF